MKKSEYVQKLEDKVLILEMQVKHLRNDLRLTREENEVSVTKYFEIYSHLESRVAERTRDLEDLQKALEQKAHELEIMLDTSPAMIFYKDVEQRLLRVNKRFAETVRLPINKILGKKYSELFPENKDDGLKKDLYVIKEEKPILNNKESIETSQGKRQILLDRMPYKDVNDNVIGLIGFALDVTDLEKAQEEKRGLESRLQHAQRMESIGTLAGGIAHNFNNLLMGILGNASLMLLDTDSTHPHYESLKSIEKLVKSGSELTSHTLGYAREGKYEIKLFSLSQLVIETSNTFAVTKKEIKVHRELDENLLWIKGDYGQIEQVLLNLFVNAADAMPRGGDLFLKMMNLTHEDIKDKTYQAKPGNYILLTLRDTGVGMDKKTKERIFEPFFTTKGLARGTGLGLASAYGIIKGHGGYIDVNSVKGHGTTFNVYLPATEEVEEEKEFPASRLLHGQETVLLVDDEEMVIDVGMQMLKKLGYEVLIARGGREALELCNKNRDEIDMVLLDMIMPDMGGSETYDRMRGINPNLKVLLSSGYSINGQAKEILDRGCDGFLQKPFKLEELSEKIREIIDGKSGPAA
jgi:PAS domain S-box-containing protein